MKEYDLLTGKENIGFYNSCEITELVIMESNNIYNLYTIVFYQRFLSKYSNSQFS